MVIVWRGLGIAIPIAAAIAAGVLSQFIDDTRLGNLGYLGWILIATAAVTAVVALVSFGGKEAGGWAKHSLFFIPVVFWVPLLGGIGGYCLYNHHPAAEKILGTWEFSGCVSKCDARFARSLEGMRIQIDKEHVTVGDSVRTYAVDKQKGSHITFRYQDNGEKEPMTLMGDDVFVGFVHSAGDKSGKGTPVQFVRVSAAAAPAANKP